MIRFENVGLRYGMGAEVLRDVSFELEPRLVPLSDRPVRGRQDLACCGFCSCRCGRHAASSRCFGNDDGVAAALRSARHPPPHRRGVPGFSPARSSDDLRERGAAAAGAWSVAAFLQEGRDRAFGMGRPWRSHQCPAAAPCRAASSSAQRSPAPWSVQPDILLADEPTGNVDPRPCDAGCCRLFIELNRLGTSVIIATHDFDLMEQVDARRLILSDGRLTIND